MRCGLTVLAELLLVAGIADLELALDSSSELGFVDEAAEEAMIDETTEEVWRDAEGGVPAREFPKRLVLPETDRCELARPGARERGLEVLAIEASVWRRLKLVRLD